MERTEPRAAFASGAAGTLSARRLTKWFGASPALDGVSIDIEPGTVHAIAGVNGSGKTTLLRILSGQIAPDSGEVALAGVAQHFVHPRDALARGISVVSQERTLVPQLSVAENLYLARRMSGRPLKIDWKRTKTDAGRALESIGVLVDPTETVGELAPDQQQMVEIARAVTSGASYLLLDEPTSSLSNDQVARLMGVIRRLTAAGVGVVFVTHRLEEIFAIGELVTVMRDGRIVAHGMKSAFDARRLTTAMLGGIPLPLSVETGDDRGRAALEVNRLSRRPFFRDVSLTLHSGEIVGLAGLEGSGRSEVVASLYGRLPYDAGEILLSGRKYRRLSPHRSLANGIGYVPPDRKTQGLAVENSVADNLVISKDLSRWRLGRVSSKRRGEVVDRAMERFLIRAPSGSVPVRTLSGGNQQKVLLGRVLLADPKILLLDEPTRGVDVGAKREIYSILKQARSQGVAILLSGADMEELVQLADRILVMRRGRIVGMTSAANATVESLVGLAAGQVMGVSGGGA